MSNNFVEAFSFIYHRHSLLLDKLETHAVLSAKAVAIAIVIGVPLGVLLGHLHRFSFLAINISNLGRALPSLAVLAILLPFVGIGDADVIIALVILAAPPILTNAYVAVDGVDPDLVDAAKGIGLKPWQVILRVELPPALPLIFAGIRTAAVFVIATATLSGVFGGGGLGDIISNEASFRTSGVIGATYVLVVFAFASQALFLLIERLVTPAGMRLANGPQTSRFRRSPQTQAILTQGGVGTGVIQDQIDSTSNEGDVPASPQLEKGRST